MSDTAENLAAPTSSDPPPVAPASVNTPTTPPSWLPIWTVIFSLSAVIASIALIKPLHPVQLGVQPQGLFIFSFAALFCATAALSDGATNRIPNRFTISAILLGLLLNCLPVIARILLPDSASSLFNQWLGSAGPTQALLGFGAAFLFTFLCVLIGGMDGGDAKAIIAVASILGFSHACVALIAALTIAVVYSLINLIIAGRLNVVVRQVTTILVELVFLKSWTPLDDPAPTRDRGWRGQIAVSVPLALGVIISRIVPLRTLTFGLIDA